MNPEVHGTRKNVPQINLLIFSGSCDGLRRGGDAACDGAFSLSETENQHQLSLLKVGTGVAIYVGVMKFQAPSLQEEKI